MDIIGIYIITCVETERSYIGSALRCGRRIKRHLWALRNNCHYNSYFQRSWNKYGEKNFRWAIVEECKVEDRFICEQWWIDYLKTSNQEHGFNLAHSVQTLVPSPYTSRRMKEMWDDEMRREQAKRSLQQYKIPEIREIRLEALARGRDKSNQNPTSKMLNARGTNLAKGSVVLKELLKDPIWVAGRKTGSRTKEVWERPGYREMALPKLKQTQKKGAVGFKNKWDSDPEFRQERMASLEINRNDPAFKSRHKKKLQKFWSDPEYRARHSARMKARWAKYRIDHDL